MPRVIGGLILSAFTALALLGPAAVAPAALQPPQWVGIYDVQGKGGLLWIKAPNVQSYRVYRRRSDESTFTLLAETQQNRFNDDDLQPRITYFYRLTGVTARGDETPPSVEISFTLTPRAREVLPPPAWEGHLILDRGIGLKWSLKDPSLVVAFNIYRSELPSGQEQLLASTRETSFTDFKVERGKRYRYRITALDRGFKETVPSEVLETVFEPPREAVEERAVTYEWKARRTSPIATVTGGRDEPFLAPADVALSGDGLLFVSDSGDGRIKVFDRGGVFRYDFPVPPALGQTRSNPLGLTVGTDNTVYCVDSAGQRVLVFRPEGKLVGTVYLPPRKEAEQAPTPGLLDVCLMPGGELRVTDNLGNRVLGFSSAGVFQNSFGEPGLSAGQFTSPGFCSVDSSGHLLVSESLGARVQFYDREGHFLRAFGRRGKNVGTFARPKGVALDSKGRVYVADSWLCQIQVFDTEGRFLHVLSDEEGKALDLGSPNGIAIDGDDNIYIAERLARRIQIRHLMDD